MQRQSRKLQYCEELWAAEQEYNFTNWALGPHCLDGDGPNALRSVQKRLIANIPQYGSSKLQCRLEGSLVYLFITM